MSSETVSSPDGALGGVIGGERRPERANKELPEPFDTPGIRVNVPNREYV